MRMPGEEHLQIARGLVVFVDTVGTARTRYGDIPIVEASELATDIDLDISFPCAKLYAICRDHVPVVEERGEDDLPTPIVVVVVSCEEDHQGARKEAALGLMDNIYYH